MFHINCKTKTDGLGTVLFFISNMKLKLNGIGAEDVSRHL